MKIITTYEFPPIPIRSFDWSAVLEGFEGEGGRYEASGATKREAELNLLEQLECA
jgi:hypothetical protein